MTLNCKKLLGALSLLLVFHALCDAAFKLYLKDGTSKDVSRIYFNGPKVDLYPINGAKMTVSRADIDYERSGFKEPEAVVGVSIYGTHEAPKEEASRRPAYEDLESLWNDAKQRAVASKDFGTITRGQEVRVIGSDALSYTIIAREQDGGYTRRVIDSETFFDAFESSWEKKRPVKSLSPLTVKLVETRFPEIAPPEKPKPMLDANLYKPLGLGFVYLLLLSIAIPSMNRLKERFYEFRFAIILIFLAVLAITAKIAYDKGGQFYWQDKAKDRVSLVFDGISNGGRIEEQTAVSMWAEGIPFIADTTRLYIAAGLFDQWKDQGGIWKVSDYMVTDSVTSGAANSRVVMISAIINGKPHKMLVDPVKPIQWLEE